MTAGMPKKVAPIAEPADQYGLDECDAWPALSLPEWLDGLIGQTGMQLGLPKASTQIAALTYFADLDMGLRLRLLSQRRNRNTEVNA